VTEDADRELLDTAVDLLRRAGELTLQWFRSASLVIDRKSDGTPVTEADRAAERFLRDEISRRFPDDTIIGEEEADRPGTSGREWIIDPIDGTKAFTHGVPLFCNLLAVNDEHGPAIGVINLPALEETVYAGRGLGCYDNGEPARVSERSRLPGSYLSCSGLDYWPVEDYLAVRDAGFQLRTWGDGYGYALAATGRVEAMVDPEVALWDVAPMAVIMEEAGGRFTDYAGAVDLTSGTGIATNGLIHDELVTLLGRPAG
jgi:histidinol-phosphatase